MQAPRENSQLSFPTDLVGIAYGIALFGFAIFAINQRFLQDPDTYWHIETGRWIWTNQAFPRTEIFSHTVFGKPWTSMEWLSQVILYASYALLDWHGVVLVTGFAVALTFTLLYFLLARRLRATVALGASAVCLIFASAHLSARPHVLSYPVIVLWVAGLCKACDEQRRPSFWLLPLMTLWANLHGAFTFGLVFAAGLAFEAFVTAEATGRWRVFTHWAIFGVCALAAACINPYGYLYLLETYHVFRLGSALQWIGDWRPMNADSDPMHEAILLVLLALALINGVKLKFPRALLVVGILHFGLKHVRGLPMVALTWPFLLAGPLRAQFAFLAPARDPQPLFGTRGVRTRRAALDLAAGVVAVAGLGALFWHVVPAAGPPASVTPKAAVDYALRQNLDRGPVLNDFDFGGYLIFRGIKVFIDGRTLPFGRQFAIDYFEAQKLQNMQMIGQMADAYKVTWALTRKGDTTAFFLDHSPDWRRAYADDIAVIHVRR